MFTEGTLVNYYEIKENVKKEGMLGGKPFNYIISQVDETPKRSHSYRNCLGIIAVGEDKETGKQISFLSHQNPSWFLSTSKDLFETDLYDAALSLISRAKPGTVDIGIIGGNYYDSRNTENPSNVPTTNAEQHKKAIEELPEIIKRAFKKAGQNIPVTILSGADYSNPIADVLDTDIAFDTQARLLFESRPKQEYDLSNEVYDSYDEFDFTQSFDKNKSYIPKGQIPNERASRIWAESKKMALEYKKGFFSKEPDFVPTEEREMYLRLKDLGVTTYTYFKRQNKDDIESIDVGTGKEDLLVGTKGAEYAQKKFEEISNLPEFIENILNDLLKISEEKIQTVSGPKSFIFTYNANDNTAGYYFGGIGGFRYFEDTESKEMAFIQNVSSLMKSFHTFLDTYAAPEKRNEYMKILNQKIKEKLKENLSEEKYISLVETLY